MATKKTYTPGTGNGRNTEAMRLRGKIDRVKSGKDKIKISEQGAGGIYSALFKAGIKQIEKGAARSSAGAASRAGLRVGSGGVRTTANSSVTKAAQNQAKAAVTVAKGGAKSSAKPAAKPAPKTAPKPKTRADRKGPALTAAQKKKIGIGAAGTVAGGLAISKINKPKY